MSKQILWQRPRLHEHADIHRKVSWLELFFDLVFVVVISELVHLLSGNVSLDMVGRYLFLFIPAWWVWMGATYYNDRFETEGLENRFFTFLLMLPVAGLAICAHHVPDTCSLGYGLCYMVARLLIVIMWVRASIHEKRFRPVGTILASGYSLSILLFICSLWFDNPTRFILWAIALALDLITPLLSLKKQAKLPHFNVTKLPERLGLFILIVIGETLVGVIRGIARHHHLSFRTISEGIMGIAISFAIWWLYFDYVARRAPKNRHSSNFFWSYLHLALVMGIGAVGASLLNVLTSKHHIPTDNARYLMTCSLAVSLIFVGLIETVLERDDSDLKVSVSLKFISAIFILLVGLLGHELRALSLLGLVFLALLVPMGYGVFIWFFPQTSEVPATES